MIVIMPNKEKTPGSLSQLCEMMFLFSNQHMLGGDDYSTLQ